MNKSRKNKFGVVLAALVFSAKVLALSTDSQQPLEIEADFAVIDDQDGRTIYRGNVIVTQGSIRMTGDEMKLIFTPDRELQDIFLKGRPAYFKQTPDGNKPDIEGEGLTIEYHQKKELLILIERARLTQGGRLAEGHRINYDTGKSIMTMRSVPKEKIPGKSKPKKRRVRVIIPPKKTAE